MREASPDIIKIGLNAPVSSKNGAGSPAPLSAEKLLKGSADL
jgi:hypothetical protein